MLENVHPASELRGLARRKTQKFDYKTIAHLPPEENPPEGWAIEKKNKRSLRLKRAKSHGSDLEDRVWCLLYRMRFQFLSGEGGATLRLRPKDPNSPKNQIDVVGIDDDVAVAIECKSSQLFSKRPQFQEELGKHALIRESFANAVNALSASGVKKRCVLAMFMRNVDLSDADRERAKSAKVVLFDEDDLKYYEKLVSQLGPAAKYQFFADMLPGVSVPGLKIRVPAIETKIGAWRAYSFCVSPEYLLKIAFISHRRRGKSDVDTYQRMVKKDRLEEIRKYISEDGIFPTNIVVNFDEEYLSFQRIQQDMDEEGEPANGKLGWLDIRPSYKSAWIIDGQHRLFGYSGHEYARRNLLPILGFQGLPPSKQAQLFIDINARQKRVKQSLLEELFAELHWDSEKVSERVSAIVSKAVQILGSDPSSPFCGRIQSADEERTGKRCISLTALFGVIDRRGFHVVKEKHGHVIEPGPLWAGDQNATLRRTVTIIKHWFNLIRSGAEEWWDKGSEDGGGLAMNDSIAACVDVLRSVLDHLEARGEKLLRLNDDDLASKITEYGTCLGRYFSSLSENERRAYRARRGIEGQTFRARQCQQAIRNAFPDFNPPGLEEHIRKVNFQTNDKADHIIKEIETKLQALVIGELKDHYGTEEQGWWTRGVPQAVRLAVTEKYEKDNARRGGKEFYFELLDYKKIAVDSDNWPLFEKLLGFGKQNGKEKKTSWLDFVNEVRKGLAHPSSRVTVSLETLSQLEEIKTEFDSRIAQIESLEVG